jgi:hypothetical protein
LRKRQGRVVKALASLQKIDVKEIQNEKTPNALPKKQAGVEVEVFLEQIPVCVPVAS